MLPPRPIDVEPKLYPLAVCREERIVWLLSEAELQALPYIREGLYQFSRRRGRPKWGDGRLLGYAELRGLQRGEHYSPCVPRRVFWLANHDRALCPDGVYNTAGGHAPSEAVDPLTVAVGVPGRFTERSQRA